MCYSDLKSANKADFIIQLINGSTIYFKSSERPETIRGLSINYAFIDEAQDCKDLAWKQSILPTLTAAGKKCIITGTPKRKNWFYDIFMLGKSKDHPNHRAYHGSSEDSPYVSKEFIEEQKRTLPPKIYKQEFLAEWQDNEGAVFKDWIEYVSTMTGLLQTNPRCTQDLISVTKVTTPC